MEGKGVKDIKNRITINEITKGWISISTVSRVISGKNHLVNEKTRKKIFQVIKQEKYIPNTNAQSLRTKKTRFLAISNTAILKTLFIVELQKE
ncbi:MAG: LacI family DNA-binding transcriptional regulator [Actinomycetota bacterium]|nr:LacI family DNA-binding transcriptional regulator [Actinomycetota bacterium]